MSAPKVPTRVAGHQVDADAGDHVDQEEQVRLIGFRWFEGDAYALGTLREVTFPAETFYGVLTNWITAFEAEWQAMPKTP